MKQLFILAVALLSFSVHSQENSLLDRSFWKKSPDVAAVEAEIKKGNNPAELNSNAFDPVVLAINEQASNDVIKMLLNQKGNDVNKKTHDGRTYIFWASYRGNIEIVEFLLQKGAKTNVFDDKGYSPLNFAASSGQENTKIYDVLIESGIDPKKDFDSKGANALLLIAPHDKDFTLINYFVNKGLDLKSTDKEGNTAFNYAARVGNIATLKALVEKGVKYNDNAILIASQGGRGTATKLEVYQYLESLKLKPTVIGKNGETALHNVARKEKQKEVIEYLLSKGLDINKEDNEGNTPFLNAASGNPEANVIEMLSSKVKDINHKNKKGVTALALALKSNSPEIVRLLLEKGADSKVLDNNGDNLIVYLMDSYNPRKRDDFETKIKILREKGLDFAAPQKNGTTVYHLALAKNDLELLQLVERFKADVNQTNGEGMTPLQQAALTAKDDVILKYLLALGAKKETATEFGETAYDLASENEMLTKKKVSIDFLK